jgi:HEAT repeat protein
LAQSLERVSGRFGNDEGIIAFSFRLSQRAKAVDALGRIGHVTALPALRRLLGDPEPDVRVAAAKALAGLGETKWQACVTGDQKSDWLALGESREPLFRDALVRALLQGNRSTRRAAAKGLGLLGDNSAEEPLLQVLTSQESNLAMVRCAAALALADLKSSKAVEPLIRILGERTPAGQCELTRLKDAARLLSPLSKTGIADFMQEARMLQFAKWLGTNHVTFSFPFDYDISHFEEDMQELRLRELGCGPHPGTCESLVRCAAVIAFGSLGSDRAVAALRKARDDEDKWVSLAARLTVSDPAQAQWSALAKDPNKDVTGNTRDANASSTSPPEAIDKERSAFLQLLEAHWAAIETAKAQELATAQGALEKWKREWEKRRHGPDMRWRQLLSPPRMPPGWRPHIP